MTDYPFTSRMQAILGGAAGEAQRLDHEYIGTEHILLALLAEGESCAATALRNLGVDLDATATRLLSILKRGRTQPLRSSGALLPLTSRVRKALELAGDEARRMNHPFVGTEHLLLGILAEGKGVAAGVLFESGLNLTVARTEVLNILGRTPDLERVTTSDAPTDQPPSRVAVVLEYRNGAVVSKHFRSSHEAIAFLQSDGRGEMR